MLYLHMAHVENPVVTSFEVTSCRISTHLTCSGRQKSLWIRQGCICLQSLCLQAPACPFVDGMNKSFCATHQGRKGHWLHWVERWVTRKPQVLLAQGWPWALAMGGRPGKNFPWAEWRYFPWFLSPPSDNIESMDESLSGATILFLLGTKCSSADVKYWPRQRPYSASFWPQT